MSSGGVASAQIDGSVTSGSSSSGGGDRNYRKCLSVAVAAILTECGFDSAAPLALESVTEVLQAFLSELGRACRSFSELACRNHPLPADILLALAEMGSLNTVDGLKDYAFRTSRKGLPTPSAIQPPRAPAILHTGDRRRHRAGGVVPENFVEFPDSHSYVRTPTHKQPVTDYESVREKAASQKRDVERALTRFVAKTAASAGRTHSLFRTDDTNLFPLISCDRGSGGSSSGGRRGGGGGAGGSAGGCGGVLADQPLLPAYVSALLFRDQIFEEDEREFQPKKKKEEIEEDDSPKETSEAGAAKAETEDQPDEKSPSKVMKKEESDVIDNPFLRPVTMPRTQLIKRSL